MTLRTIVLLKLIRKPEIFKKQDDVHSRFGRVVRGLRVRVSSKGQGQLGENLGL